MNEARDRLQQLFAEQNLTYPVLVQGDKPKAELLSRFRELGNAVLIGSHSFWEGVDVKGEALSVVVIDRLPFSPPDDPVVAARQVRVLCARDPAPSVKRRQCSVERLASPDRTDVSRWHSEPGCHERRIAGVDESLHVVFGELARQIEGVKPAAH